MLLKTLNLQPDTHLCISELFPSKSRIENRVIGQSPIGDADRDRPDSLWCCCRKKKKRDDHFSIIPEDHSQMNQPLSS